MITIVGVDVGLSMGFSALTVDKNIPVDLNVQDISLNSVGLTKDEFCSFALMRVLEREILLKQPALVVFEGYIYRQAFMNMLVPEMCGQLKRFLIDNNISYMAVDPKSLKKIGMGKGNATDSEVIQYIYGHLEEQTSSTCSGWSKEKLNIHMADAVLFSLVGFRFLRGDYKDEVHNKLNSNIVGDLCV